MQVYITHFPKDLNEAPIRILSQNYQFYNTSFTVLSILILLKFDIMPVYGDSYQSFTLYIHISLALNPPTLLLSHDFLIYRKLQNQSIQWQEPLKNKNSPIKVILEVQLKSFAKVFMLTIQRLCFCSTCSMFLPFIFPKHTHTHKKHKK